MVPERWRIVPVQKAEKALVGNQRDIPFRTARKNAQKELFRGNQSRRVIREAEPEKLSLLAEIIEHPLRELKALFAAQHMKRTVTAAPRERSLVLRKARGKKQGALRLQHLREPLNHIHRAVSAKDLCLADRIALGKRRAESARKRIRIVNAGVNRAVQRFPHRGRHTERVNVHREVRDPGCLHAALRKAGAAVFVGGIHCFPPCSV